MKYTMKSLQSSPPFPFGELAEGERGTGYPISRLFVRLSAFQHSLIASALYILITT